MQVFVVMDKRRGGAIAVCSNPEAAEIVRVNSANYMKDEMEVQSFDVIDTATIPNFKHCFGVDFNTDGTHTISNMARKWNFRDMHENVRLNRRATPQTQDGIYGTVIVWANDSVDAVVQAKRLFDEAMAKPEE